MEFPDLGQNCAEPSCRQLDFLPVKCDACSKVFCREHMTYFTHNCPLAFTKDVQVPACPLCNQLIHTPRGTQPDESVGRHIDNDCRSDTAKSRRKVFVNRCSVKKCHGKEMIRVVCDDCKQNYCLKHRHPVDHECQGKKIVQAPAPSQSRTKAAEAAIARMTNKLSQFTTDCRTEAKAKSSSCSSDSRRQLEEDEALARAIALSEQEYTRSGNNSTRNGNCTIA